MIGDKMQKNHLSHKGINITTPIPNAQSTSNRQTAPGQQSPGPRLPDAADAPEPNSQPSEGGQAAEGGRGNARNGVVPQAPAL